MSTKEKLVNELINWLKNKGVVELKYIQTIDPPGRGIEIKLQDGTTIDEVSLDEETTDNVDTLFRLLEHLKKIPESEEAQEVQFEVNGLTLKYEFWA